MPKTPIGHARIARDLDVALRLLDFENWARVFGFWITRGPFRDWGGSTASEHD